MWFSCFRVLPSSAEAQLIWCGIVKHLLIAYVIRNISAKKNQNPFMCVKVIASQRWGVFWDTVYLCKVPVSYWHWNADTKRLVPLPWAVSWWTKTGWGAVDDFSWLESMLSVPLIALTQPGNSSCSHVNADFVRHFLVISISAHQTSVSVFVMVALCNRADHYIFALWFLYSFFLLFFLA